MTTAQIIGAYRRGLSCAAIARRAYRCETSIRRILEQAGVDRRPAGGSDLQLEQAVVRRTIELYREHGTTRTAEILGVAKTTVRYRLRMAGEPMPNQGRPPARPIPAGFETADQAAAREGVSGKAIRLRIRRGEITGAVRETGSRGRWLIPCQPEVDA